MSFFNKFILCQIHSKVLDTPVKNPTGPQHVRENNESRQIGLAYQNNSRLLYPNQCAARKE